MNFGNRKWIAWFTPEIPISDGPYKFCGLPGLILKINDSTNSWNFDVTSIHKIDTAFTVYFLGYKTEPFKSKEAFLSEKEKTRDNAFKIKEASGCWFQNKAASIKFEKERARKDNNWIELYKGEK